MGFNEQYNNIKQLTAPEIEIIEQKMIEDINLPEPVNTENNFLRIRKQNRSNRRGLSIICGSFKIIQNRKFSRY